MNNYKEEPLLPKQRPSKAIKRSKRPMNWISICNRITKEESIISLHDTFCHKVEREEYLSTYLQKKYRELILSLHEEFSDLKNIKRNLEENIRFKNKATAEKLAVKLAEGTKEKFELILNWYSENDTWPLKAAICAASKRVFQEAIREIKKAHIGDRPLGVTREDHAKESERNKSKKSVADLLNEDGQ